jgi:F0F1-type ATP synthase assembly protein I
MTKPEPTIAQQFALFALVISQFVGASAVGIGLGWVLWKKAGFPWWSILITAFAGIYAAGYQVVRYQRQLEGKRGKS